MIYRQTILFSIGLMGAIVFAQFPAFYDQYLQRLGGATDEARQQVMNISSIAASLDKTPVQLIDELIWEEGRNAAIGHNYAKAFERRDVLVAAQQSLQEASAWTRPVMLAQYADEALLQGTWADYQPAMPVTWAGFMYAVAGFFLAGLVLETVFWLLWLPFSYGLKRT